MKRLVQAGVLAVVLAAIATVTAQSPAADVTFRGLIEAKNIGEYMRVMARARITSARRTARRTPSGFWRSSRSGAGTREIEPYDVLFPTPKERVLELVGADAVQGRARGAGGRRSIRHRGSSPSSCRPSTPTPSTATSPGRSSTSTTAGPDYEELERRGISVKGAIVIARYGAVVARHQAEGRRRARRDRLPDLLRSARRRVYRGRRVSGRADAQSRRRAARQRDGHADVSRRSADARASARPPDAKRLDIKAVPTLTKIPVLPISYGDAQPLLAALGGPVGAGRLARRAADHLSHRARPGARAPEGRVRLEPQARSTTSSRGCRARRIPTSGSSAATITTRG